MPESNSVATLDALMNDARPDGLPAILEAAKSSVIELLAGAPRSPSAIRVTVGPVMVEMDWPVDTGSAQSTAPAPSTDTSEPDPSLDHIHSPTVGVFYRAPEPGARPFVSEGDTVVPGQQVGIVEAMKLMIPVQADRNGSIDEFLQPNGALVEYGDPLCSLVPAEGR